MSIETAVIAGNGLSLETIQPGQVLASDYIVRTNNFFFEPTFFLGDRVDLAFMGGDPRVAPFVFETLYRKGKDYDLRSWSSHNGRVQRAGRRFSRLFQPLVYANEELKTKVAELMLEYQRHPMTGTYGALMAHGLGARDIVLVGMDFYSGNTRYLFEPGPHYRALMGKDLNTRSVDRHLHNPDLDLKIFELLAQEDGVTLTHASQSVALDQIMDTAPQREGPEILVRPRQAPTDWSPFAGVYPIRALRFLRSASRVVKRKQFKTK